MEIFNNTLYPRHERDDDGSELSHSVDVIVCDDSDMLHIGFYDYEYQKWRFHTETLVDPYEGGEIFDFVWAYKPEQLTCQTTTAHV